MSFFLYLLQKYQYTNTYLTIISLLLFMLNMYQYNNTKLTLLNKMSIFDKILAI
jgi:hypothetical protein